MTHPLEICTRRSPLDAVDVCRERCLKRDWVIDLDIKAFFDTVPFGLILRAVARHTDQKWILLYVERWLKAPVKKADGTLAERTRGTPQGGPVTPPTQQRTFAHVTLRVGFVVVAAAAGWFPDRDAVADGDFLGSDEDVLDDGAQDALAVPGGGGGRVFAEPGEEALEVAGDLPRAFRTAYLWLIHAADCRSRYSLRTCCGVRY